jgi:hypothetical protein
MLVTAFQKGYPDFDDGHMRMCVFLEICQDWYCHVLFIFSCGIQGLAIWPHPQFVNVLSLCQYLGNLTQSHTIKFHLCAVS